MEVRETVKLYLAGRDRPSPTLSDLKWYAIPDRSGVVFLLNVPTAAQAHAILDPLPFSGQAKLMEFRS